MTDNKLPNTIDRHVGRRVRWRRRELKLSQEKLAAMLGLTFQQVQKYEKGANRISSGRLFDIARALNTTVNYFYHGIEVVESRTSNAVAEPETDARLGNLFDTESMDLVLAFQAIDDVKLRRFVLRMVNDLSGLSKIEKLSGGDDSGQMS